MAKNLDELDLSGVDDVLAEETLDLSGVDEVLSKETDKQLVDEAIENKSEDTLMSEAVGTGIGGTAGYGVGKGIQKTVSPLVNKAIGADLGISSKFIEEFGQPRANELADVAVKEGIYSTKMSPEKQLGSIENLLKSTGESQADFYERIAPKTVGTNPQELIESFSQRTPSTRVDDSKLGAYKSLMEKLEEIKKMETQRATPEFGDISGVTPEPKLSLRELQDLKKDFTDIAYREGKALTPENTVKTQAAGDAATAVRQTIDKRIGELDTLSPGSNELQKLKDINKKYKDLSDLELAISKKAAKEGATSNDILALLKRNTLDAAKRGTLTGLSKHANKLPILGTVLGTGIGAIGGAIASENPVSGAAQGALESFTPESLGQSELPKSQMGREALEQEMRIKKEVRQMPAKEQAQVVDALKGKLDYTPEEMMQVSEKLLTIQGGKSYADVLNQAAQQPERTRKSITFGLLQQPAFRELMKKVENGK